MKSQTPLQQPDEWILASSSPRRRELLAQLGHPFRCLSPSVDEWEPEEADPAEQVLHNARSKAAAIAADYPRALVIASDTTVALGRRLFAKPVDTADAIRMLKELSGQTHQVLTAVALQLNGQHREFHDCSEVRFKPLSLEVIEAYITRVHVLDKAGGYAIQECSDLIIDGYSGSFENIMGLPIQRLRAELADWGILSIR